MDALQQQAADCDFVRFTCADIHGISRGRCIPRGCVPQFLKEGIAVFAGVMGVGPCSELVIFDRVAATLGNVASVAMPGTFHVLPWAGAGKYKVGEVLCETFWSKDEPQKACPRYVARRQLQRLADLGSTLCSGWEEEFILLHKDTQKPIFEGNNYICNLLLSEQEEFYLDLFTLLEKSGVDVEAFANEYAPGQMELATKPTKGIGGIDMAFNFKQAVKEISAQRGFQAVFMTKPFRGLLASGLHYNFSLTDQSGQNVFASNPEAGDDDKLSEFGRHFLGGLMKHAPAMCVLCCPTVNCYRRLQKPWAPGKITWGFDNRIALLRVKFGSSGPFFENRLPSAAANPYLVVAATLAAGLDGVSQKIEPPQEMDDSAKDLPRNLQEALQALEDDKVMCDALGSEFVEWFVFEKKTVELEKLKDCDLEDYHPEAMKKEHEMYFQYC